MYKIEYFNLARRRCIVAGFSVVFVAGAHTSHAYFPSSAAAYFRGGYIISSKPALRLPPIPPALAATRELDLEPLEVRGCLQDRLGALLRPTPLPHAELILRRVAGIG